MDSFELNKIIGAALATVFIMFSVSLVSDSIFAAPVPHKPGYAIEAAEGDAAGGGSAAAPAFDSSLPLLASANVENGATLEKRCAACHNTEKGGPNKTGPNLYGLVDRPIATHEGFAYSAGIKEFSEGGAKKWTYDNLDHFISNPKGLVKGTAMAFAGLKKAQDRADLLAYLRTLADSPVPLPDPAAAAPAAAPAGETPAAAPAGGAAPAEAPKH